jgi:hypothetical protein
MTTRICESILIVHTIFCLAKEILKNIQKNSVLLTKINICSARVFENAEFLVVGSSLLKDYRLFLKMDSDDSFAPNDTSGFADPSMVSLI